MQLIHPDTYRHTQDAIRGCDLVAYTSIVIPAEMTLRIVPPSSSKIFKSCTVIFVTSEKTSIDTTEKITSIVHKHTADTWHMSARKFSKLPKLCPHLLFGNKTSVFFDSKLHMRVGLDTLHALSRNGQLTAFRHPKCPKRTCDPYDWMLKEGKLLSHTTRVDNQSLLFSQIQRYRSQVPKNSCKEYIDGALLIQKNAHELFEQWSQIVSSNLSADRDQIAFAHVAATNCFKMHIIEGCEMVEAKRLCHWYRDTSVAKLVRTTFEKRPAQRATLNASRPTPRPFKAARSKQRLR